MKDHYQYSFRIDQIEPHQGIKASCSWFDVLRGNVTKGAISVSVKLPWFAVLQVLAGEYALWPKDGNVAVLDSTRVSLCSLSSPPNSYLPLQHISLQSSGEICLFLTGSNCTKFKNNVIVHR